MNQYIITDPSNDKFEFQFDKSIGEDKKYINHFSYAFAQNILQTFFSEYKINDEVITIEADIPTLTNLLAGIIKDYGDLLNRSHDILKTYSAEQRTDLGSASEATGPEAVRS